MRARLSMIVATGVLAAAGAGSFPSVASATCSGSPAPVAIGTSGFAFAPPEVTITTCTPVTWTLSNAHTATSDSSSAERFDLSGAGGTHVFLRPGDYDFYCRFHRSLGMTGIVHVTGPDQDNAPTAALSAPSAATAGQDVTLDGSASSDPDTGDTLLYRWDLDGDGTFERTTASATTATSFPSAGTHTVGLEVVDDHGKQSAVATATVTVQAAPSGGGGAGGGGGGAPQPFGGVKLAAAKVKVGANRIAAIRVTCPAGTGGGCAGKLTLKDGSKRVASKSFTAAPGKVATVKLRLAAAEARKLRKRHRLKLRLGIASRDGAGQAAPTRTVRLTLVAKR